MRKCQECNKLLLQGSSNSKVKKNGSRMIVSNGSGYADLNTMGIWMLSLII
jgi:hypothetical protein